MTSRSYSELCQIDDFVERFRYLALGGSVGVETFGYERFVNQRFYASTEWRNIRHHVIARDLGCDLGYEGFEIFDRIYIHHMNPMTVRDIRHANQDILDPEYLISVSHKTHNAIHYSDERQLPRLFEPRRPGDTKLWQSPRRH